MYSGRKIPHNLKMEMKRENQLYRDIWCLVFLLLFLSQSIEKQGEIENLMFSILNGKRQNGVCFFIRDEKVLL